MKFYIITICLFVVLCGCPYKPSHHLDKLYVAKNLDIYPTLIHYQKSASQLDISILAKNISLDPQTLDFSNSSIICNYDTFLVDNIIGINNKKLRYVHQIAPGHHSLFGFRFIDIDGFTNKNFQLVIEGKDSIYAKFKFFPK